MYFEWKGIWKLQRLINNTVIKDIDEINLNRMKNLEDVALLKFRNCFHGYIRNDYCDFMTP